MSAPNLRSFSQTWWPLIRREEAQNVLLIRESRELFCTKIIYLVCPRWFSMILSYHVDWIDQAPRKTEHTIKTDNAGLLYPPTQCICLLFEFRDFIFLPFFLFFFVHSLSFQPYVRCHSNHNNTNLMNICVYIHTENVLQTHDGIGQVV